MKLNVMCGKRVLDGYTNVDIKAAPGLMIPPQIIADARRIPLPDACADELMVIHGLEHFYLWDAVDAITEWRRLLEPGGLLVLELPDIIKCAQNVVAGLGINGDGAKALQLGLWGIFGNPDLRDPHQIHRWGWTPDALRKFLTDRGFHDIYERPTEWHGSGREHRDMRIEARKKAD